MSYLFVIYGFNLWNNVRPIRLNTLSTIIVLASDTADDPPHYMWSLNYDGQYMLPAPTKLTYSLLTWDTIGKFDLYCKYVYYAIFDLKIALLISFTSDFHLGDWGPRFEPRRRPSDETLNRGPVCLHMHLRSCTDLKEPGWPSKSLGVRKHTDTAHTRELKSEVLGL